MLTRVQTGEGGPAFSNGMNSVVSATASANNQVIIYDHWEDGLEADINNPVQATTLVIGDGNTANGQACDFTTDPRIFPCGGSNDDDLFAGSFLNFNSNLGLGCAAPPNDLNCSVPVNPRNPADIRFDGGDLLIASGGPLALVHPQDPLSAIIGGTTEIIPRQAVANATLYSIPVGEDIYMGDNSVTEPFKYVDLNLVAFDDNTSVNINSPGAGNISFTLNRGQHYSTLGLIDGVAAPTVTVNAGTRVSTTGPLAGLLFTGGDGNFATRFYSLLPDILHASDYVITAPGDDPIPQGSRPLNLYVFNPDPLNAITVAATDSLGTVNINIPAASSVDYLTGTGHVVPPNSTVRMTSDRNFWGISAYGYNDPSNDWGHSWLSRKFVTANYTVPFAPGVNNPAFEATPGQRIARDPNCTIPPAGPGVCDTINRVPIFVSALVDNTRVQIDFDNDGTFDVIDLDGDDFPDPAPQPNNTYVIDSLASLRVYDHNDYDNTGTSVVANKPVALAYGQDTDQAVGADPVQDTGYAIYPINQIFLDPALVVDKSVNTSVIPTAGGVATYTITVSTFDFGPFSSLEVFDLLPAGVTGADYVPGSTLVTYPNLTQDTADPATSIDVDTGLDRLDWTLSPTTIQANQTLTIRYSVLIPASPGNLPRELTNVAHVEATLGGSSFSPTDTADVVQSNINLTKSVDDLQPEASDILTFTLNVINNGVTPETNVEVIDPIPTNTTFVPASITSGLLSGSFDAGQNAVVWTIANFPAGAADTLTFQVMVNPGTPSGTEINNLGTYESTETPLFFSNEVDPVVVGPNLVVSKSGSALLHPNEVAAYTITVDNIGDGTANNVDIVDFFPANVTYVPDSMEWHKNVGAFTSVTDAADLDEGEAFVDRLVLTVASLGAGEDLTFRFLVQVDPLTGGLFANNQASISSDETAPVNTNLVQSPIVGDADVTGHVFLDLDGDGVQGGGEPDLANISVLVTDGNGGTQIVSTDANGDYIATLALPCYEDSLSSGLYNSSEGDLDWSTVGYEWTEFSAAALNDLDPTTVPMLIETDPLGLFDNSLLIEGGPAASNRGFTRQVDLSSLASFSQGRATLSFNSRRVSMEIGDDIQLDIDYDNDGTFNDVLGTFLGTGVDDPTWQNSSFILDAGQLPDNPVVFRFLGTGFDTSSDNFYVDNIQVCNTQVTVNVDETDPDLPAGVVLSTANDPQNLVLVAGGSVAATPVGYEPPALSFTKVSDTLLNEVQPGQTVTYTMEAINNTGVAQTGIDLNDPLPTGTTYVGGTSMVTLVADRMRVTEYPVAFGSFTGTSFNVALNQDLSDDYFVIVRGSDGLNAGNAIRNPDQNYARLSADPFGTGDLATTANPNEVTLIRGGSTGGTSWVGIVTVVECLADCDASGFRLRGAELVNHGGVTTSGTDNSAWDEAITNINQVVPLGGFKGAGCSTLDIDVADHKVCHARFDASAADTIDWTRDNGGTTSMSTADSTVLVVEWGSEWTVQQVRVTGNNGGDGVNVVGEYNTGAISSVTRANTWVWGTGHTNDQGVGDAGEGVLVTLGDGVSQNVTETLVAVGLEHAGNNVDFEVYTMTHSSLAVDYRFKADGDSSVRLVDVTVDSATSDRMALVTNGMASMGNFYPASIFFASYLNDTTVRLERRLDIANPAAAFPAWVQGIDFSNFFISATVAGGAPPNLVVPGDGFVLDPGGTMTVTFQVLVDDPLAPAVTDIVNTATLNTDQQGPFVDSVSDKVIRLDVTVEPNNAGFAIPGDSVTYTHVVTNTGDEPDSYALTLTSELGYIVELIDPSTGAVIATDTDGDGVWDGGVTVNTGTLAVGEMSEYRVRVHVPLGTPVGTEETTTLLATSDRDGDVSAFATDETTVVDSLDVGPVALSPDHSGVVTAGGAIAYTHTVTNNTGSPDTFDLTAFPTEPGWTATIYNDSNGDGVYTDGVDVAITNTPQLADGELQTFFVVVMAPPGAMAGDTDVVHLTAISQADPALFDAATDTTTLIPATTHDLSGGGTLLVEGGDIALFPGTIKNLQDTSDRFDLTITPSLFLGLDGLNHPTTLIIDTNGDGTPDLQIAEDTDGDGVWDTIAPGFDTDSDLNPDVEVLAGAELAYELRRAVDLLQPSYRDPVTLTATSQGTGEVDSITATNLLAAATHAVLVDFQAYEASGRVVVEWETASEVGTLGFLLRRQGDVRPAAHLPSLRHAPQGGTYRWLDDSAVPGQRYVYQLIEVDVRGGRQSFGPFEVVAGPRPGSQIPDQGFAKQARQSMAPPPKQSAEAAAPKIGTPSGWLRIPVAGTGLKKLTAVDLATAFSDTELAIRDRIQAGTLRLELRRRDFSSTLDTCLGDLTGVNAIFGDGFDSGDLCAWSSGSPAALATVNEIAWLPAADGSELYFHAEALISPYASEQIYWLTRGPGLHMANRSGGSPAPVAAGSFTENLHLEEEFFPLTSVIQNPDGDFWFWQFFLGGDPSQGTDSFTVATPGAVAGIGATLKVHLQGESDALEVDGDHHVVVRWNGLVLGEAVWDGANAHTLELNVPGGQVNDGNNTVEITALLEDDVPFDVLYLNALDVSYTRTRRAIGDVLETDAAALTTIEGFSAGDITVLDITRPGQPVEVVATTLDEVAGEHRVSFNSPATSRVLALLLAQAEAVSAEIDMASDLRASTHRAEYLVLAGAGLEAAASNLANYRAGQGLESLTVRLQDVYDEWNGGVASPWAIRDFLVHARASWQLAPSLLVLAGDGSFDFKDRLGTGENIIPSPLIWTPDGLFPSDIRLVDLEGSDGAPEIAVGRLPVRTNDELTDYVDKLIAYDSAAGDWQNDTVWLADDVDKGGEFVFDTEDLIAVVPPSLNRQRIYVDQLGVEGTRQALLDAFEAGALLVNYLGHGGHDRLASEGLMTTDDVAAMTNGDRLPVLTALTCSVGRFDFPGFDTLSESLVRHSDGGVIALWSPAGLSFNAEARRLDDVFLRQAFLSGTFLGDAVKASLASYADDPEMDHWLPFVMTLLGDPALQLTP